MKCCVLGGGISGLALASGLARMGHDVEVIEARPALEGAGAGLLLHDRALAALRACGVEASGRRYEAIELRLAGGGRLAQAKKPGEAFARPALYAALRAATEGVEITLGATISALEQDPEGVDLTITDGRRLRVDRLFCADGINGASRGLLGLPGEHRYSGVTCWRLILPEIIQLEGPREYWGRGARLGIVPLLDGTYVYLTANAAEGQRFARLPEAFEGFTGAAREVLDSIGAPTIDPRWLHHDLREHPEHAYGGARVHLLGDAAHALTPNLGEGAAQALLDAEALLRCVESERLGAYPGPRRRRAAWIAWCSRWIGVMGQLDGRAAAVRDACLSLRPA